MPQIPAEKSYFTFRGGLHSDSSPINFPEEVTLDEANFTLERDGSRKRRRGLAQETGGVDYAMPATFDTGAKAVTTYAWRNADGNSTLDFTVVQLGDQLTVYADGDPISSAVPVKTISLTAFASGSSTDDQVDENPVSFAAIRGVLVVTGRYIDPFHISYSSATFVQTPIPILERDFFGVDDGLSNITLPLAADLSANQILDHTYNLRNRGWEDARITTYLSDAGWYPAKNQIPWKGYKRVYDGATAASLVSREDGLQTWDSTKLAAEVFGDASAPKGSLVISPFNTQYAQTAASSANAITTWTATPADLSTSSTWEITATTTSAHGIGVGVDFTISGNVYKYNYDHGLYEGVKVKSFDGVRTSKAGTTGSTLIFDSNSNFFWDSWNDQFASKGGVGLLSAGEVIEQTGGISGVVFTTDERPQLCGSFAGRIWYAGIASPKLENKVYFSRIIEEPTQLGYCLQAADPTAPEFNQLTPSDGGTIIIPDMGLVRSMKVFSGSLLLFAENGVWSISGNRSDFAADNIQVRKISDVGATSPYGVVTVDDSVFWASSRGLFKLFQDPQTGFLTSVSLSQGKIDKVWDAIPTAIQARVKTAHDRFQHRVYFLYSSDAAHAASQYDTCLVYDTNLEAFYKLVFPSATANYIMGLFTVKANDSAEVGGNIKFIVQTGTLTTMQICDLNHTDYLDFDGLEQLPYMVTGYDNLQDFHRQKQAPVIHTFMNKTETGYTLTGTDLVPNNESSVLMRPLWDWADHTNTGKYGAQSQVYRHRRYYQPADATDTFDDGHPVVVTRNKLRGRGRVLHLRFDGETAKDAHILGWSIYYKGTRRV